MTHDYTKRDVVDVGDVEWRMRRPYLYLCTKHSPPCCMAIYLCCRWFGLIEHGMPWDIHILRYHLKWWICYGHISVIHTIFYRFYPPTGIRSDADLYLQWFRLCFCAAMNGYAWWSTQRWHARFNCAEFGGHPLAIGISAACLCRARLNIVNTCMIVNSCHSIHFFCSMIQPVILMLSVVIRGQSTQFEERTKRCTK